jgi:hypothetical protein
MSVGFFAEKYEKNDLLMILEETSTYVNEVITRSASRESTPAETIAFLDMEVENLRQEIADDTKKINKDAKMTELAIFSDPILLEIQKRHIQQARIGNCGEHVVMAITYLLENYKDNLKNYTIDVLITGASKNYMNHVFLRISDKKS